jgi:hypothetical protein
MKLIAIFLLFLIFPITTFAEDIPIIKPVQKGTAQHLFIEKITMDRNLFYLMIAGDVLAVILIIIILVRRFASFV